MRYCIFLFLLLPLGLSAQKTAYIPNYLLDGATVDGSQFTWDKTAESENFTLIWGDDAGIDPPSASDPDLRFHPQEILDTLEWIYQQMADIGFVWDTIGTNLHLYKIPVIMLNTFGPDGVTGWAFGGDTDGIMGTFWAHPLAMKGGHVAAHELTHSLQAQCNIDYRSIHGLGPVWQTAGIFWETHANFMRNLIYPQDVTAWGMDVYHVETWGDWKNTYENYALLMALADMDGLDIINRLWRESLPYEYPLQAYKRLRGFTPFELNDHLYDYAKRMATYDISIKSVGNHFRARRTDDLQNWLAPIQATWTILEQDSLSPGHFSVPIHLAPEEFAYNMIPIHPHPDSCVVIIRFKGHTDANPHAGWRYGFVTAKADGTVSRYGETNHEADQEIAFELLPGESAMYFVVMGAPTDGITTNPANDTWKGYPKHFRFPYEMTISGGSPEGAQAPELFRPQLKNGGHLHPNGGGWVENSATVANSVFIGPHAIVLGNSQISGDVRITNTAIVRDALVSDQVIIEGNACVLGGTLSDQARIGGQAFLENNTISENARVHMRARVSNYTLHGDIEVGGDVIVYNSSGDCDNGVYYRMTNYYQDNLLECDHRTANHPDNLDVNNPITAFESSDLSLSCNCENYPGCLTVSVHPAPESSQEYLLFPNPVNSYLLIQQPGHPDEPVDIQITDLTGHILVSGTWIIPGNIDLSGLPDGLVQVTIRRKDDVHRYALVVQH